MNNNTQESKIQLEYINKCTELVKEKYENAPAFFIQNAGCQMNSLQTDTVAGIVKRMGYTEVSREARYRGSPPEAPFSAAGGLSEKRSVPRQPAYRIPPAATGEVLQWPAVP